MADIENIIEENGIENPFEVPKNEDVFGFRQLERKKRKEKKEKERKKPIHKRGVKQTYTVKRKFNKKPRKQKSESFQSTSRSIYQRQKMNDFIDKKRQMFHIQLAIDTKKKEILKLKRKSKQKEKSLDLEERELKKNEKKFTEFVGENDVEASKAMKLCNLETQKRISKQNVIKNLQLRISTLQDGIAQSEQKLNMCLEYKAFLDSLTPKKFIEQQSKNFEAKSKDGEVKPVQMFFVEPMQFLSVFSLLEKKNLDLITQSQEIEEQIEFVRKEYLQLKKRKSKQIEELNQQLREYQDLIEIEQEKLRAIRQKKEKRTVTNEIEQELRNLLVEIRKIFLEVVQFYHPDNFLKTSKSTKNGKSATSQMPESELDHLYMLTNIETTLEKFIQNMQEFNDQNFVFKIEKEIEKERRQSIREEKSKQIMHGKSQRQKRGDDLKMYEREEKKKKVIKRKKLMERSVPFEKKSKRNKKKIQEVKIDGFTELFG